MTEQLFKEIRLIEQEAEKIISDSERQSAQILRGANRQALRLLSEKESELKQLREKTISTALHEASMLREKKISESKGLLEELRATATKKKEKSLKLILKRVSELIGE